MRRQRASLLSSAGAALAPAGAAAGGRQSASAVDARLATVYRNNAAQLQVAAGRRRRSFAPVDASVLALAQRELVAAQVAPPRTVAVVSVPTAAASVDRRASPSCARSGAPPSSSPTLNVGVGRSVSSSLVGSSPSQWCSCAHE